MGRSIKKNFIYQSAYQIVLIVVPLVTTPYLSRVLGPDQIGVFSVTQAITNYFVMFAMLGMSSYGVRAISMCRDDRQKRSRTFCSAFAAQLITSSIALVVYLGYTAFITEGGLLVCLLWGLWVLSCLFDITWLFFGVEEFKMPTIRATVTRLVGLVVILLFVKNPDDLWIYVLSISGMFLANQLLLWPFVKRYVSFVKVTGKEVLSHILPSARLLIPAIAISLYTTMDKILVGGVSGMVQAGFFEYSEKLARMPTTVITAMGTVMLPRMAAMISAGKGEESVRLLGRSIDVMLAMAMLFCFGIIGIANDFSIIFLGSDFASCAPIMAILAVSIPIISITNVLGRQYLVPYQKDNQFVISVCCGAAANLVLCVFLLPPLGALGAGIATLVAEFVVLLAQWVFVRGKLPLLKWVIRALPYAGMGLVMMLVLFFVSNELNSIMAPSAIMLAIEVVVGLVVYGVLFLGYRAFKRAKG